MPVLFENCVWGGGGGKYCKTETKMTMERDFFETESEKLKMDDQNIETKWRNVDNGIQNIECLENEG